MKTIARQLNDLYEHANSEGHQITFGSDDPGLYSQTCERGTRCYGDPLNFFEDIFNATDEGTPIISDARKREILLDYLDSTGNNFRNNLTGARRKLRQMTTRLGISSTELMSFFTQCPL